MKRFTIYLVVTFFSVCSLFAQNPKFRIHKVKDTRYQYSLGSADILGDLGGGPGIGRNHIGDIDLRATRGSVGFTAVYRNSRRTVLRLGMTYAYLFSSDGYTTNGDRRERNFKSTSHLIEPSFLAGYQVTRVKDKYTKTGGYLFLTAGVASPVFRSHLTHVETGNSQFPIPKDYGIGATFAIPFGFEYRYYREDQSSFGVELLARKTFSDLIDGTRASYYGDTRNNAIKDHYFTLMFSYRTGV